MVHDARARHGEPQPFQERHLQRLARLEREHATAVENRNSAALEVDKVVARGEDRFAAPSLPRRRAHAVEDEGEVVLLRRRVEEVSSGVDPEERNLPPRQLRKERLEPVRVLVENRDRSGRGHRFLLTLPAPPKSGKQKTRSGCAVAGLKSFWKPFFYLAIRLRALLSRNGTNNNTSP